MTDIETHLKNMEVVFQKDVFKILSVLIKRRTEHTSFTLLKTELKLNPNSLSKYLTRLMQLGLVENHYEKTEDKKSYSFYRITKRGLDLLHLQVGLPRIWELVKEFKEHCKSKGWGVSEYEDWIQVNGKYYHFLWARFVRPLTFTNIAKEMKAAVRTGISYQVVDVAAIAWLFSEPVSEELYQIVMADPKYAETIAIYDLSEAYLAGPSLTKLNNTNNQVFQEFESFLKSRWNLKFTSIDMNMLQTNRRSHLIKKQ